MKIRETTTPVVIINCLLGSLAIMRSLGSLGIPLYGIDTDQWAPGVLSKYCRKHYLAGYDETQPAVFLRHLRSLGQDLGQPALLIPTSDETALFVATYAEELSEHFIFPNNHPALIEQLMSKKEMYELALRHHIPTPKTVFPKNLDDVEAYMETATFPVMLKGVFGNRLQARNHKKMVIVRSKEELLERYTIMEDPARPNLMLQEYIPGGDDQIHIFNGYFNARSDCMAAFTGYKIRQFPVHTGCASLGECRWNEDVAMLTTQFMKAIAYRGVLDIGYRLDPRDGQYKVLDINPRVGQAFRLFVDESGMDVVRALYLDLTDQPLPPVTPREGRRWVIEDFDVISTYHYFREGSLSLGEWFRSFRRVEEGAWWSWKDPVPFFVMLAGFARKTLTWVFKSSGLISQRGRHGTT